MDITGRLTGDAVVHILSDARQVVNFSVAVNDSYKTKNGERVTRTEFFDCSYWIGAGIAQYLTKGSIVELSGRVSVRAWLDGDGQAKAGLNFHTSKITLHGGNNANSSTVGSTASKVAVPVSNGKGAPAKGMEMQEAVVVNSGEAPDDDMPF